MLNVLLTNDDGVLAPGLILLKETLSKFANVVVIAPETDSSGGGSSITLGGVLRLKQLDENFYALRGTPADCVHAALTGLLPTIPDIVISGINNRSNLGDDIIYSGTFGAAYEGRRLKYPSIALSMVSTDIHPHFDTAAQVCQKILTMFEQHCFFYSGVLNINVPDLPYQVLQGYRLTCLGQRPYSNGIHRGTDPRGDEFFWLGSRKDPLDCLTNQNTDFYAVINQYVSITPIKLDMTDQDMLQQLKNLFH